jgi:Flp pilus assembly protein TadG
MRDRRSPASSSDAGQAVIEFVLIAPVALMLLFGVISACYLFYQSSALHDGASGGARAASIETSLVTPSGSQFCESNQPVSIEQAIASAAPYIPINMTRLCGTSSGGGAPGVTQLTQSTNPTGGASITVSCTNNCSTPTAVSIAVTFNAKGLVAPMSPTYTLHASSQVPMLSP